MVGEGGNEGGWEDKETWKGREEGGNDQNGDVSVDKLLKQKSNQIRKPKAL